MSHKVLIIGAGGVGRVVAYKCAQHRDVFGEIMLASRTKKKCDAIADAIYKAYGGRKIKTARLDADVVEQTVALIQKFQPDLVINVALPYQDLPIMDACLETGVNYMDTANYEPKDVFEIKKPIDAFLPAPNVSTTYVFAKEDTYLVYPNNYNHFVTFFKNTFQHGGVSLEEMVVPLAFYTSK